MNMRPGCDCPLKEEQRQSQMHNLPEVLRHAGGLLKNRGVDIGDWVALFHSLSYGGIGRGTFKTQIT